MPAPVDLYAPAPDVRVVVDGVAYRGSLRILVNPRGTLNVINRVDLEEYLWGVVPAEMGPKRFDAHRGAQGAGHRRADLRDGAPLRSSRARATTSVPDPKCQAYGGASAEDPLSTAAVEGTRGLVLAYQGQFADALFVSTCGGVTENVENVFSGGPLPYLVSVPCGELPTEELLGAKGASRRAPHAARLARVRAAPAHAEEGGAARGQPRARPELGGRAAPRRRSVAALAFASSIRRWSPTSA